MKDEQVASGTRSVRMAVVQSRLEGVVRAMMNTLLRTARSGVLSQARDFSCCILTGRHELLAAADSLPIHVMSGPDLMAESMAELHPDLAPGDAFLHNSPYHGGSHPADHSILVPVFDEAGKHRMTIVAKGHQADIGNSQPTTYMVNARDVYEEGALIFPCTRIQRDYRDIDDIIRLCQMRIRVPEQWWGDYLALLGAARVGERRIRELAGELGWPTLDRHAADWFDYSAERMRSALRRLPSGRVTVSGRHDPLPAAPDGIEVSADIEIDSRTPSVVVDVTDNPDAIPAGVNLSEACTRTAAMLGIFNSLAEPVPANAGSFRLIDVKLRDGCVVGRALHPSSCSASTTNLADRLANAVQRGVAELADGYGLAEAGLAMPPSLPVISGRDARHGDRPFINQLCLASTGGPGGPHTDGWLTLVHVGNAGVLLRDSVEGDERQFPIRIVQQRLVPDTEGAGRLRGAPSVRVEFAATRSPVEVIFATDGNIHPAAGVRGGGPGGCASQYVRHRDGELEEVAPFAAVTIEPGESVVAVTCGGGGYGPPRERDPRSVAADVLEGWITPERAVEVYGAAVAEGEVDIDATLRARDEQEVAG